MASSALSLLLAAALYLFPSVQGDSTFSYVQPLDTTILTQYGSSPPVYPSRTSLARRSSPPPPNLCVLTL